MSISTFLTHNVIWIALGIVIIFLIIRYLNNTGYFKKVGLDFSKIDLSALQSDEDFFGTPEEIKGPTNNKEKPKIDKEEDFWSTEYDYKGGTI